MAKRFEKNPQGIYSLHFDSVGEMVSHSVNPEGSMPINRNAWQERYQRAKDEAGDSGPCSFFNGYTLERAVRELESPPQAAAFVREIADSITLSDNLGNVSRRHMARRREDGDTLDAMAWVQRDLAGWERMEKTSVIARVIRIACNVSVNYLRQPEELYYRGAACAALADVLESAGHSVEITAIVTSDGIEDYHPNMTYAMTTIVKHAHMPMDVDTVSLVMSEIGFFRTVIISALVNGCTLKVNNGKGAPVTAPPSIASEYDVLIDCDITTKEQAIAAVKRYGAQGVEV